MQDEKNNSTAVNAEDAAQSAAENTHAAEHAADTVSTGQIAAESYIDEEKEIISDPDSKEENSEVIVTDASEVAEEEPEEEFHYVPKLSENQQKIWQTVMGLVAGFAVWFSLGLSTAFQDNGFLRWLFLLVFVVVMVVRAQIEKRTGVILRTFMKFFLIGLIVFLVAFIIYGLATGKFTTPAA